MNDAQILARVMEFGMRMGTIPAEDIIQYIFRNTGVTIREVEEHTAGDIPVMQADLTVRYEHTNGSDKKVFDFVFTEPRMGIKKQWKPICAEAERLGYHLYNFCAEKKLDNLQRVYRMRLFKTSDFPCTEHPEMLLSQPIGMYHCSTCGQMQCAGTPHLPLEENE